MTQPTPARGCEFDDSCDQAAAYLVTYDKDWVGGTYAACVDCAAEARANDPLEYIESVQSYRAGADA